MINRTKLTQSLTVIALTAAVLSSFAPIANAQTPGGQSQGAGFFQGLMQFFEKEFGLNKSQVQSAVQQYKTQRNATITPRPTLSQQQMSTMEKSRLDKLVSSGKITSDQETAILSELSTEQSKYASSLQGETPQQRRTTMQSMQSDLKSWAQANNINPMYVMTFGGMRGGRGMIGRGGYGHWGGPTGTQTVTPTPGS